MWCCVKQIYSLRIWSYSSVAGVDLVVRGTLADGQQSRNVGKQPWTAVPSLVRLQTAFH